MARIVFAHGHEAERLLEAQKFLRLIDAECIMFGARYEKGIPTVRGCLMECWPQLRQWNGVPVQFSPNEFGEKIRVNERGEVLPSAKKENVTHVGAVFVDDDNPRPEPRRDFKIPPTAIVQTSAHKAGNKYHYFWMFDKAVRVDDEVIKT